MLCSFLLTHARTITQEAQKKRVQQLEAALRDRDKLLALLKGKMMKDEAADSEEDDEDYNEEEDEVGIFRGKAVGCVVVGAWVDWCVGYSVWCAHTN